MSYNPITVWSHALGPNPFKAIIALEELGVPYEKVIVENPKDAAFTAINPNGRLPAIKDPNNNNLILWESGAILEYIIETYDKEKKLTSTQSPDKWYLKQYLHFQMSGQGPYFGQLVWFHKFHPEDVPAAKKRYLEQTARVFEVLDKILQGKKYLVADKCTYADLSFIPWDVAVKALLPEVWKGFDVENKYPNYAAWHARLIARPSVQKTYEKFPGWV
ncbi:hypothetical protein CDD82_5835 [Ophiocordyceps australis]|uniref:Glutathione S-transferase n=1 Tax=Ophiocordyceps australis TaxID=1399860 RepID=A0A2C5Z0A3_9HYPO|nr:hypothetical protein CDD82_5835 [Ophiocordyceps australis]